MTNEKKWATIGRINKWVNVVIQFKLKEYALFVGVMTHRDLEKAVEKNYTLVSTYHLHLDSIQFVNVKLHQVLKILNLMVKIF